MRIREERQRRGWSQHELGRRADLPASTISALECGYVRAWPAWRRRLATAFKLPEAELFDHDATEQRVS